MSIQAFGGVCPCCNYERMFLRYGLEGYFQFEACPCCGFAFGKWSELEGNAWAAKTGINQEIWEAIEVMDGFTRYQAFQASLKKEKERLLNGVNWKYTQDEISRFMAGLKEEKSVRYDLG